MGFPIKQSQTAQPLVFLMVLSSDHVSPATGKTPTVTISKNGGSFAAPSGAVSEIGSGWYKVAGNATDSGTLGPLLLHATEASSDPADDRFDVVAYDPQATSLGLVLAKATNIIGFNDIAATAIVSNGAITTNGSGKVSGVVLTDTTTNLTNAPAASDSAGVTTLLARLTATRAGYLDNLSGGAVATHADVAGLAIPSAADNATAAAAAILVTPANRLLTDGSGLVTTANPATTTTGVTAADVWGYATRTLTDRADFALDAATIAAIRSGLATSAGLDTATTTITTAIGAISGTGSGVTIDQVDAALAAAVAPLATAAQLDAAVAPLATSAQLSAATTTITSTVSSGATAALDLTQLLGTPRALDGVADAALTVADGLFAAICGAAGQESVAGTGYLVKTPAGSTTLRTFVLDDATDPTARA